MPNRPRPRPRPTPQAFDIFKPGKGRPSPNSRPMIVSSHPGVQDHTVVEKKGTPVANAHHMTVSTPAPQRPKPVLKSLEQTHPDASKVPAPAASAVHMPTAHRAPAHAPPAEAPLETESKKVSRTGVSIAPPSASAVHKLHPVAGAVKPPVTAPKPEEPAEPNLAAVPITPMEPTSGSDGKVEGKEELLAAMPIEIRRSIASSTGQQASEWNVPDFGSGAPAPGVPNPTSQQPEPVAAVPAELPAAVPVPGTLAAPLTTEPAPADTPEPAAPAPQEQMPPTPVSAAKSASPAAPMSSSQAAAADHKRSEAAVFIIMFVLFLLLATLVILLFLSGSIAL